MKKSPFLALPQVKHSLKIKNDHKGPSASTLEIGG